MNSIFGIKTFRRDLQKREYLARILIYASLFLLIIDTLYKYYKGINYLSRYKCILYSALPRWIFLIYEYFIELFLLVIVGIFIAALIEKYFSSMRRFIPQNPFTAFVYASILPLCSCSVIPLIKAMKNRVPFNTVITFVIAAPLLNPYIIILSMTILGLYYTILRVLSSMVLAILTGYIAEYFYNRQNPTELEMSGVCNPGSGCPLKKEDLYEASYETIKKIFPFLAIAGLMGIGVEYYSPGRFLNHLNLSDSLFGTALVILIGIPVYFCNGADILFLHPLVKFSGLPLGTAIAFSLTSTSVCISSIILLIKFIGKNLTFIIVASIMIITFVLSYLIHLIPALKF